MNSAKFILVAAIVSLSGQAHAETADGNGALALVALVAENSPLLGAADKTVLAKFLNGQTNVTYPAGETTLISVDKITCRASNVDITYHSCDLVFGKKTLKLMDAARTSLTPTGQRSAFRLTGQQGRLLERSPT